MKAAEIQERSLVIAFTSLCVLATAIGWFVSPGELTLPLALVSLVPPLGVAFDRASRNGIMDPLAVFALSFAAYNGVLLLRMNYAPSHETLFPTNGPLFFQAGILSGVGSLGIVVGWLLSKNTRSEPVKQGGASECTTSFLIGTGFYVVGVLLYLVQYSQVGGYMQSAAIDRGQRFEMMTHTVSMPYEGFVLSGLSLMVYASMGRAKLRLMFSSAACLIWLGLVLFQGDRRLALQMILAVAVVVGTMRPNFAKLRPVALVSIVVAAYSAASIFGQYRAMTYDLAAGRSTLRQAQVAVASEEFVMGKPEDSELGGPYMSVLYYARGTEPLRWGSSYAMSIPAALPRALYPGEKTPAISADLDQTLHEGDGPVYGWGFSPIAEGFANFGLVGAFGAMVLWSIFFAWLNSIRYRGVAGMVVCATLLQETVNANRIDFRYVYFESVYCGIVAIIAVMIMKAVTEITARGSNTVRTFSLSAHVAAARKTNAL